MLQVLLFLNNLAILVNPPYGSANFQYFSIALGLNLAKLGRESHEVGQRLYKSKSPRIPMRLSLQFSFTKTTGLWLRQVTLSAKLLRMTI
jgi:hypothetical protein